MPYIRRVAVAAPGTRNEHIISVHYSTLPSGACSAGSVAAVVAAIDAGSTFRTHNDATGSEAPVVVRTSSAYRRYISTVADGTETNNLLALQRI